MLDHGNYIAHQQTRIVVLHAFGLVAQVVAALVDGDALILVCKAFHLAPPGVPEIGEAVDHHDKRPTADGGVMDLDPVGIGSGPLIVMIHGFPDFWYTWRRQMEGLADKYQCV